ncbi:MAG: hypothetical protein GX605_03765, partial [Chloroflexi bacterium]|nr:hypothetical protein [Chloroflexota bacterium]
DGKVYLGVSTEFGGAVHAHFVCYDPATDTLRDIVHLEDLLPEGRDRLRPPHAKIHTAMMAHPDGRIFWVSHTTPPIEGERVHRSHELFGDPERGYLGSCAFVYDPATDRAQNLGRVYPHCGTRFATLNPERDEIYTVSYPTAHFNIFRINTGESKDLGRISRYDAIGPCWSSQGCAYTTDDDGYLIRYDPDKETLERLPVRLPSPPGHMGHRNRVRRIKAGPDGVKLYGLTGLSARLFEYDPAVGRFGQMRDLGLLMGEEQFEAPNNVPQGKALTFGRDGYIYIALNVGVLVNWNTNHSVHIMRVHPESGEAEDFGRVEAPGMLPLHSIQDACTDSAGNIYFGTAVAKPPAVLAAFHPKGLPGAVVRDQAAELAPYRLAPAELKAQEDVANAFMADRLVYYIERNWSFVSEGTVLARPLGVPGYMPPIPDGESAVTALAMGSRRRLYGATSGCRSHLFVYIVQAHRTMTFAHPIDLGLLPGSSQGPTACRALVAGPDGCIYGGMAGGAGRPGRLFRHDPAAERPQAFPEFTYFPAPYDTSPGRQIEDLGAPLPEEGIVTLTADWANGLLWGLGSGGTLFSFAPGRGQVQVRAHLEGPGLSRALLCDPSGNVYGSMGEGRLFQFSPADNLLRTLPQPLPCGKGRGYINALSAAVWGADGRAYGGTTTDGVFFSLEVGEGGSEVQVRGLGKPTWSGHIRALAAGVDGAIYGVAGRDDLFSRLFRYDPADGALRDLGILQTEVERPWVAQRLDAMATGPNGEIFLGEADRVSHLWVYLPPVVRPAVAIP